MMAVLTVRPGARAAIRVVSELVDVHAALGVGIVAGDVPTDGCVGGFGGLLEGDGALDVGVTPENGDCNVCRSLALLEGFSLCRRLGFGDE